MCMTRRALVAVCAGALVAAGLGDIFTTELPGLEGRYGGFIGDVENETTYDFGTSFETIISVTLSLAGITQSPNMWLEVWLDGEWAAEQFLFEPTGTFDLDVSLAFGPAIYGGAGAIRLILVPQDCCDLSAIVEAATLAIDDGRRAGDLNCDGLIDAFDIDPFVLALTDPAGYEAAFPNCQLENADVNGDGVVNAFDIDPFVELLTGG